ncbi:MAG: GNAT family N-acetyltransferase [Alphaproteobacteria bacterium]|nr:GNAT family N-acetyltransferase [Alphaproteobacteria bacterium]
MIQIAPAGLAMVPVIGALHIECFDDPWSEKSIAEVLASPGVFAYLAVTPGERDGSRPTGGSMPCGFAIARVSGDEAELLSIGVGQDWRRRGIAHRLIDAVLAAIEIRRVRRLYLEVAEDNESARRLYATYEFVQVGRRDGYYRRRDGSVAALTMCRPVGRAQAGWTAASL